jgi:hypothetical protein
MASGIQVWAPNGELIADTNDRFSRIIASGAIVLPAPNGYRDVYVSPEYTSGPDFLTVVGGGALYESFSTFFRVYYSDFLGEGSGVLWTVWAR